MNYAKVKDHLAGKVDWFDIYSSESRSHPVKFVHSVLEEINEHEDSGTGIRINKNGKTGFSYTNNSEMILKAAEKAVELSNYGESENFKLPGKSDHGEMNHEFWKSYDKKTEILKGENVISTIRKKFTHADVSVNINSGEGARHLVNSEGFDFSENYKYYSAYVSALLVDEDGSRLEAGYYDSSTSIFDIDFLAERVIADLENASRSCKAESGPIPVIFTPDAVSSMLSIILAGFHAKQIYKKLSPFCGKIGSLEFSQKLSVIDDPAVLNSPSSYLVDDEGVGASRKFIIREGVVENIISDIKYASLLGIGPSGNSSRSYAGMPYASFSNIIIEHGQTPLCAILKSVPECIIADRFIGLGQSNTLTGDFSANLDMAFLVKNGEIKGRIKDCMVSGNIFEMLKNNIEVSSEFITSGGSSMPYVFFEKINLTA